MNPILESALLYTTYNCKVFPLKFNSKNGQLLVSWKQEASKDHSKVTQWFFYGDVNIGVRTGEGFIVIDVDVKNGKDGMSTIKNMKLNFPKTKVVKTPNNGFHIYYYVDRPINCRVGIYEGIDIRGENGYVLGIGSTVDGKRYEDTSPDVPIALANEDVYKFLEEGKKKEVNFNKDAPIEEGQRNDILFRLGCFMHAKGMSDEAILAALKTENINHCSVPLSDLEINKIIQSITTKYQKGNIENGKRENGNIYFNATDFESNEIDEEPEIIKDMLPIGATLLAAPQKIGKTFFSLQLSNAIANGEQFLDRKVVQGSVLYIALEDGRNNLLNRLKNFNIPISHNLNFKISTPFDPSFELEDEIQNELRKHPNLKLVVIDTFPKIRKNFKVEYQQEYEELSSFHELGVKYSLAILLVLHVKKQIDEKAPFDNIYGSRGVTAAADAMIVLLHNYNFPKHKRVYITGKDIPQTDFLIEQNEHLVFSVSEEIVNEKVIDENIIKLINYIVAKKSFRGTHNDLCSKLSLPIEAKCLSNLIKSNKHVLEENFIELNRLSRTSKARMIELKYTGDEEKVE